MTRITARDVFRREQSPVNLGNREFFEGVEDFQAWTTEILAFGALQLVAAIEARFRVPAGWTARQSCILN